jgi:hypothetical protein
MGDARDGKIIIKDSLNYFSCPLSALPTMFGLKSVKGRFPHNLNTPATINNVFEQLPPINEYEPDRLKSAARAELIKWWEANRANRFDVSFELVRYCIDDVRILRDSCLAYRRNFIEIANIDPFFIPSTQARLSLEVFLRRHMPEGSIVNLKEIGCRVEDRQSYAALRYFRYREALEGDIAIRDASWYIGEARFGEKRRVDGVVRFCSLKTAIFA